MSKKNAVPDAWDDEWESLVDVSGIPPPLSFHGVLMSQKKQDKVENPESLPDVKVSKAELRAQHAKLNKKIWESA